VAFRPGFRAINSGAYTKDWVEAGREIGVTDTLRVVTVTRGGAADRAGLRVGDQIVEMSGKPAPVGRTAMRDFAEYLRKIPQNDQSFVSLVVRRDSAPGPTALAFPQDQMCGYGTVSVRDEALNAWADGDNVFVTTALQRFAGSDEGVSIILSHEFAHGAMNHSGARKRNSTIGAILGTAVDIAAGSSGVSTGGAGRAIGGGAGNRAFSQEFERDADYIGLYMLARAGLPYENAGALWRRMAAEKPGSILFASTHPTSDERFTRLDQAMREIDRKKSAGQALLPNRK
jgi:predicted Zn-dependent protease